MTDYVQFVRIDQTIQVPVKAATKVTAGQWVYYSVGATALAANSPKNALGVAVHTADNSSGVIGDLELTIATRGLIKAPAVVEASGFTNTIAVGDRLTLGGDAGTSVADGQGLVNGLTASASGDLVEFAEGLVVAIALGDLGATSTDADLEAILCIH